ncbi:NmrA-like family protein, putative [Penicillium digitatum PHI26]|uniref:NmrA-like family protein, putative n=2 Tax=Penicillium digitatum TaxID=36651 RepID=K9FRP0_PEND2|nr:NmrA-like family protein, putative [Penicillium digitatum Pd1]EKV11101.1 NmrA-like family protein, putative [Penicillium digitatum Pd1]EKV11824.1 NmrA-like family protein, putative [Penicillium digitatum PHI26]KAG0157704.1 hypothetical protein PDIDSM_4889 [Penicillium digitatum]
MTLMYFIIGATRDLGAGVLSYLSAYISASEYAAASSREGTRKQFEDRGIAFRVASSDDPETLKTALEGVENLFFVSINTYNIVKRRKQHKNFVIAAKKMNMKYASHQTPHAAIPAKRHAFPLFMGWYPSISTVHLPSNGPVAFTLRSELAEASARLMIQGEHDREIVLLTVQQTITFSEVVDLINETTGKHVELELVLPEEFVRLNLTNDEGGNLEGFSQPL